MAATTVKGTAAKTTDDGSTNRTRSCTMTGCKRAYRAKGYCDIHHRKWRRGELEAKPRYKTCKEENCRKPIFRKGYCEPHYSAWSASRKRHQAGAAASAPAGEGATA